MKHNQAIYAKFAEVYDQLNADLHSAKMTQLTFEILNELGIEAERSLDLCCGTGTAVRIFAEAGFLADGLDGSPQMLKVARKKLADHKARLYCQQIPKFMIPEKRGGRTPKRYDLVTSFFDSLNYLLTERDLQSCFRAVYRHLNRGGLFIFDMNSPHALKFMWNDNVHTELQDDLGIIWRTDYDKKTDIAACYATFFWKSGRHWTRFDEVHHEAGYSNTKIKRLLREVGFQIKGFYKCGGYEKPTRETNRILVVAQRVN